MSNSDSFIACSNCFSNEGLRLDAERLGETDLSPCPRCGAIIGRKLKAGQLLKLTQQFFVWGSMRKLDYGGAPLVQFNDLRKTEISMPDSLCADADLLADVLGIGFFHYGPRLWMLGHIEPLKCLKNENLRSMVIDRIVREYRCRVITTQEKFYRVRKNPSDPSQDNQYDSPPPELSNGRLGTSDLPTLYASSDLQTCLHECRVTSEDELFVATLKPMRNLEFLNVAALLDEPQEVTEFESLDLAVYMLFLAGEHSYPITRALSRAVRSAGFDGLMYPSYFSMLRNGVKPFETTYGLSNRIIPQYREFEEAKTSVNLAIFGRPIEEGLLDVSCVNRVILGMVNYSVHFGPVLDDE